MTKNIALIRGDGIGPEIVEQAQRVLDRVAQLYGHTFTYQEVAMGGNAIDRFGDPLPEAELRKCLESDSVLLGAVGGHFRRISTARILLDNGRNASDLQKLCGIPDFAARKTLEAARRFSPAFCEKAAALILETDYNMKTSFDDNERLLELLILQLSQEAVHG